MSYCHKISDALGMSVEEVHALMDEYITEHWNDPDYILLRQIWDMSPELRSLVPDCCGDERSE